MEEKSYLKNNKCGFKFFMVPFLLFMSIFITILLAVETRMRSGELHEIKMNENHVIEMEQDILNNEFDAIIGDLQYLYLSNKGNFELPDTFTSIAEDWAVFSCKRLIYDQIRFIDAQGNEKIRINKYPDRSVIVNESLLQNKKDRYYFYKTMELDEGDVYMSPLDLNIEHGEVETPLKPMIRFATPVLSNTGEKLGIIVINFKAKQMLDKFNQFSLNSQGHIYLLNSEGYWLSNINDAMEWGFMFQDKQDIKFPNMYEDEWVHLKEGVSQYITDEGLFTFSTYDIKSELRNNCEICKRHDVFIDDSYWYIVSHVSSKGSLGYLLFNAFGQVKDILFKQGFFILLSMAFSTVVAILIYINQRNHLRIKYHSEYDGLTKVYNRRAGMEYLQKLVSSDNKKVDVISLCFIDINGLKQVNDTYGHEVGDVFITTVVNVIESVINKDDIVIRLGGDEFLLAFANRRIDKAETVWDLIQENFNKINKKDNRQYVISASHGIVEYDKKNDNKDLDELIKEADELMYMEKKKTAYG